MSDELVNLIATRFIARPDVKAVQFASGAYVPDRELKNPGQFGPLGFQRQHIEQHLTGRATYGHYLLGANDMCKLFSFDIDLRKTGFYTPMTPEGTPIALGNPEDKDDESLRKAWLDRAHPARPFIKTQMGMLARKFVTAIQKELPGTLCAVAYSGNKGIHVYGFTGPMPAGDVRIAANYVMESTGEWELERGQHQWKHKLEDPDLGYGNFSVEVFPKQDSLQDKDLGNLMRLPLGRNLKSPDPTFFMDLTGPVGELKPHPDPVALLTHGDPYR